MDKKSCGEVKAEIFDAENNKKKRRISDNSRIVGGKASIEPMPWMVVYFVGVNIKSSQQCGGSLINSQFVLTAAHCFCEG